MNLPGSMVAPFVKMAGAGNDFLVLDGEGYDRLEATGLDWIPAVCRRGVSVGADGVVVVRSGQDGRLQVLFRNPDGSVAFCGNGTRCAARYACLAGLAKEQGELDTAIGSVPFEILKGEQVRLVLPPPRDLGERTLASPFGPIVGRHVMAGVPHFVTEVPDVSVAPLGEWGPVVRSHPDLGKDGANFDIFDLSRGGEARIRTWERGVEGETLACGTGAVAVGAIVSAGLQGREVSIRTWSGARLSVTVHGNPEEPESVTLVGDARVVFRGELYMAALRPPETDGSG